MKIMKKRNLLLLCLIPFTLLSCKKTASSADTSSSKGSDSVAVSSSSEAISSSKSSSDVEKVSSSSAAEDPNFVNLKTALKTMALKDKMEFDSSNGTMEIDGDGYVTTTSDTESTIDENDSSETQPSTTTTAFDVDASFSNMTDKLAIKGLKALNVNQIGMSYSLNHDLSLKYTIGSGDSAKNQDFTVQNAGLKAYYKAQYAYCDLDNEGLNTIISKLSTDFAGEDVSSMMPDYVKIKAENDMTIDDLPISNFEDADIESFVDQLETLYTSITSAADGVLAFRQADDMTYVDLSLNTMIIRLLPELYKSSAESSLDQTSEDYQTKKSRIETSYTLIKNLTDHTTVNKFKVSLGYTTAGIQKLSMDIDIKVADYDIVDSTDTEVGGMTVVGVSNVHFGELNVKLNQSSSVKYDTDVTVEVPGDHTYLDLTTMFDTQD